MKTHTANGKGGCGAQSRTAVYRAIDWLENYISKNPYTDAAIEARNIVRDLEGLRLRAGVDELLALLGQIANPDGPGCPKQPVKKCTKVVASAPWRR